MLIADSEHYLILITEILSPDYDVNPTPDIRGVAGFT